MVRPRSAQPAEDEELLDAYSRAVTGVVERAGAAVVSLAIAARGRRSRLAPAGVGSGFAVTPDGYALTNSHVVHRAGKVEASLTDGRRVAGTVVGDDPATDLALVRLEASSLPFVSLEAAAQPRAGQLAIAIGNPMGYQSTVSTGVVSACGRSLRARDGRIIDDVVQHTAPLNPGNSGGPLLDSRARLLGVNTAILSRTQGIGFAVPAATAAWVVGELLARGRVRRSVLGIGGHDRPIDRRLARACGVEERQSAVEVLAVAPRSPAAAAGLREGDLLLAYDGRAVESTAALQRLLRDWPPGKPAALRFLRGPDARETIAFPAEG
jgi:S1-C subfamily serine protease